MTGRNHQIAVQLDSAAFETLKRLSAETSLPYAGVIARALTASPPTSNPLVIYPYLPDADRLPIKDLARQWRKEGRSYGAIAKRLFLQYQISGRDSLPLAASTVRGMCTI